MSESILKSMTKSFTIQSLCFLFTFSVIYAGDTPSVPGTKVYFINIKDDFFYKGDIQLFFQSAKFEKLKLKKLNWDLIISAHRINLLGSGWAKRPTAKKLLCSILYAFCFIFIPYKTRHTSNSFQVCFVVLSTISSKQSWWSHTYK